MPAKRRHVLEGIGVLAATTVSPARTALADESDDGETAGLRVAHASPDAPAVDVYVDGSKAVADLAFGSVTDYLAVPTGDRELAVNVAGTDTTVFGPVELELEAEDYTAVARGEVSSEDTAFTVSVFEDTNGANLDDEARVRAIHASPDAPAVDVTVDDGALTLFEGVAFGESSGYAVVPAGGYEIEIRPAGGGDPVFETTADLSAGSTYTAFAVGYLTPGDEPAGEAFSLLLVEDASAPPRDDADEDDEGADGGQAGEEESTESGDESDAESEDGQAEGSGDDAGPPEWVREAVFGGDLPGPAT